MRRRGPRTARPTSDDADGPRRTCLGCRQVKPKGELVRLVRAADGVVRLDARGVAPGRGAYVCAQPACLERALVPRRLVQAFRKPCETRTDLAEEVRGLWQRQRSRSSNSPRNSA